VTRLRAERSGTKIPAKTIDFLFQKYPEWLWGSPIILFNWYWVSFLGKKWPGHEADHSLPTDGEVKNTWSYASTPHICLHGDDRDNFTFFIFMTSLLPFKRRVCVLDYGICVSPNKLILLEQTRSWCVPFKFNSS